MKEYNTLFFEKKEDIGIVWLNRPRIHNAFNEEMISEIIDIFEALETHDDIRIIMLRGKGKSFCAGADLNWMRDVAGYTYEQNYRESYNLSKCFYTIYTSSKPTIAMVHGASIGGANGLLASCDFAFATHEAVFSLSEVKIGIIPACISPYVVKRVGEYGTRDLMLTGRRIKGQEAEKYQLVNRSLDENEIEKHVESVIANLRTSGPEAMKMGKKLLFNLTNNWSLDTAFIETARMIADIRASEEGQEGMAAFLEKRKPNWIQDSKKEQT
jgi:methylglutaconyl-CoA hydratase